MEEVVLKWYDILAVIIWPVSLTFIIIYTWLNTFSIKKLIGQLRLPNAYGLPAELQRLRLEMADLQDKINEIGCVPPVFIGEEDPDITELKKDVIDKVYTAFNEKKKE